MKTFKCERNIYFLLEYIQGLDLPVILSKIGLFSSVEARFYIASILLTLQYLHNRAIIYRDLKPENIIVDTRGFIKLIDFGAAKVISGRTYTVVGFPPYVAPEVIAGRGHNGNADIWSLGICLYEFVFGRLPFGEGESDPFMIYELILSKELSFPDYTEIGEEAKGFISLILSKVPEARTGGSIEKLKSHEWFIGFDWDALFTQKCIPPFIPDVEVRDFFEDASYLHPEEYFKTQQDENENETEFSIYMDTEYEAYKAAVPDDWDSVF